MGSGPKGAPEQVISEVLANCGHRTRPDMLDQEKAMRIVDHLSVEGWLRSPMDVEVPPGHAVTAEGEVWTLEWNSLSGTRLGRRVPELEKTP